MNAIKNAINNAVQTVSVGTGLVAPPKQSVFKTDGRLTAEEFVQSGDKICEMQGEWKWMPAPEAKLRNTYLPEDKQFLYFSSAVSRKRVAEMISEQNLTPIVEIEGWNVLTETDSKNQLQQQPINLKQYLESAEQTKPQQEPEVLQQQPCKVEQPEDRRFYQVYIIYDLYYHVPRLFLSGVNEKEEPLGYEQIKQDINVEYADKTVTYEVNPQLGTRMATIHPCRHADTFKNIVSQVEGEGGVFQTDFILVLFLKFMGSIIPTIEIDNLGDIPMQ